MTATMIKVNMTTTMTNMTMTMTNTTGEGLLAPSIVFLMTKRQEEGH
jgi:hypothetical protein